MDDSLDMSSEFAFHQPQSGQPRSDQPQLGQLQSDQPQLGQPRSEPWIEHFLSLVSDAILIIARDGIIHRCNLAACELLGRPQDQVIGRSLNSLMSNANALDDLLLTRLLAKRTLRDLPQTVQRGDGVALPVTLSYSLHTDASNALLEIIVILKEAVLKEAVPKEASAHPAKPVALLRVFPDLMVRLSRSGIYLDIIAATGFDDISRADIGRSVTECLPHNIAQKYLWLIEQTLETGNPQCHDYFFWVNGTFQYQEARFIECAADEVLVVVRNITDEKYSKNRLFRSAYHDPLTNLPNRMLFLERLREAIARTQTRPDYRFAVLFLDLDRFKIINDSLGHLAGDQLLGMIAERLASCLATKDMLARFGGDEFTILLEDIDDLAQVTQTAERIQQELTHPFQLNQQEIYTSTSIGIVLSTIELTQPEDLVRNADTALYRSKALGGSRCVVFDAAMHQRALQRLQLETDLRRALSNDGSAEFVVYYQPIVSLKTRRTYGFEALLRWNHPDRGLVLPSNFIPIAEETGLIVPIGWVVLRQACAQMRQWQLHFATNTPLTININLSVKQFSQPNLVAQIRRILDETELPPTSLKLEITESVLMENAEAAARMLAELKAIGVQLALDDFGTGYSSLAYLHRFPIDTLKIDRSFIQRVDSDGEQLEIVRTIVTLAWNIGIDVVAEGIETNRQLSQLRSLRCEFGQGYLFSKPVGSDEASTLLTAEFG